jgi:hypothetical protein
MPEPDDLPGLPGSKDPNDTGSVVAGDPFSYQKKEFTRDTPPPDQVAGFHARSDLDSSWNAQHHTLGIKHDQASPGDHIHDGKSSRRLMEGQTLTGSKGGNVALANLITKLSATLGFTDSTT